MPMKSYRSSATNPLANGSCSQHAMSLLHGLVGLVGPMLVVAALGSACGSSGSNSPGVDGGTTGNDRSTDSGPPYESGGAMDSSAVSSGDGSVDSGSTDSGATDLGASEAGATRLGSDGGSGDASADGPPPANDSGAVVPVSFFVRYEAESSLNTLTYPVEGVVTDGAQPCPGVAGTSSDGVREGANCASGGHVVNQLLGRSPCTPPTSATSYTSCGNKGGGVTFNGVTVPADGTYDVTVWYHSGKLLSGPADVYGDVNCGGLNYNTGTGSGCRPHLIYVNGVQMSSTVGGQTAVYYQFPAYPDSWSIVHGAVVALPLKAGSNTIYIKAPGFTTSDAADLDALDVQPSGPGGPSFQSSGQGGPPLLRIGLVTPVVNWN
jgi:hypothetical protein